MQKLNLQEVENKVVNWSSDRGILTNGNAVTQCMKLMSEMGELADNLIKGRDVKDDIGDCFVLLVNIARLKGTTLEECANIAYEDIKDRKGFLNEQGNFIKDTTEGYDELLMEFENKQDNNFEPKIREVIINRMPGGFGDLSIMIKLSDESEEIFDFVSYNNNTIPDKLNLFIGKTLTRFKSYLITIGSVG